MVRSLTYFEHILDGWHSPERAAALMRCVAARWVVVAKRCVTFGGRREQHEVIKEEVAEFGENGVVIGVGAGNRERQFVAAL